MIFASDLDRTLIYSRFFVETENQEIVAIEQKGEKNLSFITKTSIDLLMDINKRCLFIPVTTRAIEQYKRISLFQEVVIPKYAIIANGGIILKNGEIDKVWEEHVQSKMNKITPPEALIDKISFFLKSSYITSCRCCDNLFLYAILKDDTLDATSYEKLKVTAEENGYVVNKNSRKIYIIPSFIDKWKPLRYIMDIENESKIISAGDSILDLPMLINSDYGLVPSHGELNRLYKDKLSSMGNIRFTNTKGIKSSHEFLQNVIEKLI